ncbi:MAG: formate dehydrogenase accessory protein FdhE [Chloroflexota bacterium]
MTARRALTPSEVARQVESLIDREYVAPDYLKLFTGLFKAQYQVEKGLRLGGLYPSVSKESARRRLEQGLPLIDVSKLHFDEASLHRLLKKISGVFARHTGETGASFAWLDRSDTKLAELVGAFLAGDEEFFKELSTELKREAGEVVFVARLLAQPWLRRLARSLSSKVGVDTVRTGSCPVCGGSPLMARLRPEDGRILLECSICATQWTYNRLKCPSCGNEDVATLGCFFTESEPGYRVDKCDKCRRYVKTVDERGKQDEELKALAVLDVATLYLDMLAEKEGYSSLKD